jgi:hypothetical protein
MRTPLILAFSTAAWLIGGNAAFADAAGGSKTDAPQENATSSTNDATGESMFTPGPSPQKIRGGGNVEWRRNDHPNARQNRGGSANGNTSGGGSSSDGGGGGGGGSD